MQVSLDEAIAIHARVLKFRRGLDGGQQAAAERAARCARNGDHEGAAVWSRVGAQILSVGRNEGGQPRSERMATHAE